LERRRPGLRWQNAVDGFSAKLPRARFQHGVRHSLVDLETHHEKPKAFVRKADPRAIIAAAKRVPSVGSDPPVNVPSPSQNLGSSVQAVIGSAKAETPG
jgi:hypothetical protein